MPATFMLPKGRVKIPKEIRTKLKLKEGDMISFVHLSSTNTFQMIVRNLDPLDLATPFFPSTASPKTKAETDALLKLHGSSEPLSKEEYEILMRLLKPKEVE